MWAIAIPPPTTRCCDRTASKRCAKASPCAHAGAEAIRQLASREPASSAGEAMDKRFGMRLMIIRRRSVVSFGLGFRRNSDPPMQP